MLWLYHHPPNTTIQALWPLSYRGVIYITDCASPPGITSIVFLFHPSLSWLLCSSLEWHHSCLGFPSPKKIQADLSLSSPPPSPLSLSFSDGLSQGQEFRVVCLPQNRAEDIWWTAVVCDWGLRCAPTGSEGGGFTDACGCLWASVVQKCQRSSQQHQPFATEPSRLFWLILMDPPSERFEKHSRQHLWRELHHDGHFNCAAPPQGH